MRPSPATHPGPLSTPEQVRGALQRAVDQVLRQQRPDGSFAGHMDGGVLFNAASIICARSHPARGWRLDEVREIQLAEYLARVQLPGGLFSTYPGGSPSFEATRIAALALNRVLESNTLLRTAPKSHAELAHARLRANTALTKSSGGIVELLYQRGLRLLLEGLEEGRAGTSRALPHVRAMLAPPVALAGFMTGSAKETLDGVVFPFITVLAPMLMLIGNGAKRSSRAGAVLDRLLSRAPLGKLTGLDNVKTLVRFLLDHQDGSGGFFYSSFYTQLFIVALESAPRQVLGDELSALVDDAVRRGAQYIEQQDVETPHGRTVRLLASELWDTVSIGIALQQDGLPPLPAEVLPAIARYILEDQRQDGGWSFGRRARFTDSDSTAWALNFLTLFSLNGAGPGMSERCAAAIALAFDFLEQRVGPSGGFGAWGKNSLWKRQGTVGEVSSIFLDLPAEEPTGRAMRAFGELKALYTHDAAFSRTFGAQRFQKLIRLCNGAYDFLKAQRHPELGLWPARWCVGYLPGTAFVLSGMVKHSYPDLGEWRRHACEVILNWQNQDGGYGESPETDRRRRFLPGAPSTLLHTACALSILTEGGVPADHPVRERGLRYLLERQKPDGGWEDASVYTCFTGFYCRYDLMSQVLGLTLLASAG